jgi:hypothetical protein
MAFILIKTSRCYYGGLLAQTYADNGQALIFATSNYAEDWIIRHNGNMVGYDIYKMTKDVSKEPHEPYKSYSDVRKQYKLDERLENYK